MMEMVKEFLMENKIEVLVAIMPAFLVILALIIIIDVMTGGKFLACECHPPQQRR